MVALAMRLKGRNSARWLVAGLAGAILALAAPPIDFAPAVWLGPGVLAWTLTEEARQTSRPGHPALAGACRGLAFGMGANLVVLRFVPIVVTGFAHLLPAVGVAALFLVAALEAIRWVVACMVAAVLRKERWPLPAAFGIGIYAGTFVPTMFPWTPAGGLSAWPLMLQSAEVIGERGVAFLLAFTAALVVDGVRSVVKREAHRARGVALLVGSGTILLMQAVFGAARVNSLERARAVAPHARIALVQPALASTLLKADEAKQSAIDRLSAMSQSAEVQGAALVVWPEGAYPYELPHGAHRVPSGVPRVVPSGVRGPVLTGLATVGWFGGALYNSAVIATRDGGLSQPYDKHHLVWFGETVPVLGHVPTFFRSRQGAGFTAGRDDVVLVAGAIRAAVLICYEDILPRGGRDTTRDRPNLLVNLTDDGWFSGSGEAEVHLRLSVLRAIELRRDLVRAVNLGPVSWIDAAGRVRERGSSTEANVLLVDPALLGIAPSTYARFGDTPWVLLAMGAIAASFWARRIRDHRRLFDVDGDESAR